MSSIKLIITGDLMLGGDFFNREINRENFSIKLFTKLKDSDYMISDFENIIGQFNTIREDKGSILYCSLKTFVSYIKSFPNSVFCLGNNHINDFGNLGYEQTIKNFAIYKIRYFGAGFLEKAKDPLFINDNIILMSFSTDEFFVNSKIASNCSIGCVKYEFNEIKKIINNLNLKNKILIIFLHWGYEHVFLPSPEQVELAHCLIDEGASMIIGTHPHIIQPYEIYKGSYIFYSLGNYFFPNYYYFRSGHYYRWFENSNRSILVQVDINKTKISNISFHGLRFDSKKFFLNFDYVTKNFFINLSKHFEKLYKKGGYSEFFQNYLENHYPPYVDSKIRNYMNSIINRFKKNKYSYVERFQRSMKLQNITKIKNKLLHSL